MKKLIISTDILKPALKKLGQVIVAKPALPALSSLFLRAAHNQVEMISTDLEVTVSYVCPCECQQEFEMLIPYDYLHKLVDLLPGHPLEIQLHAGNKGVVVTEDGADQLGALDNVADFPKIPDIPKKNTLELSGNFMTWLERAMASVGNDSNRPAMTKALLEFDAEGITIVSTDTRSLFRHVFKMAVPGPEQILISPKVAKALKGLETASLFWHAKHVAFRSENITIIATRFQDKFPDYKVVMPDTEPTLKIQRKDILNALSRLELSGSPVVTFSFKDRLDGKIKLEAANAADSRESCLSIACDYTGTADHIVLNIYLLRVVLNQIPFSDIRLHIDHPKRAVLVTAEEDADYTGMIMPMQ